MDDVAGAAALCDRSHGAAALAFLYVTVLVAAVAV